VNAEDPAVQGWQAATEEAESRLSTSALHRRMSAEMARVQHRLSEALSACSEMGMAYAAVALENSRLRREIAELRPVVATAFAWYRSGGTDGDLLMDEVAEMLAAKSRTAPTPVHLLTAGDDYVHCCGRPVAEVDAARELTTLNPHAVTCRPAKEATDG
jgi:hypothetical protein